jgi:hypothetical protein
MSPRPPGLGQIISSLPDTPLDPQHILSSDKATASNHASQPDQQHPAEQTKDTDDRHHDELHAKRSPQYWM